LKAKVNFSYWEKETLLGRPDFAVIGGGIVGLFTAYFLKKKQPKVRVVVFERSQFSAGASTRNAGFACFGSLTELLDDYKSMTEAEVFSLVEKRWNGLQLLRSLVGDANMDFSACGGVELFQRKDQAHFEEAIGFMPQANRMLSEFIGKEAFRIESNDWGFGGVNGAIRSQYEGKLNTGKMYRALLSLAREAGVETQFGCDITSFEELNSGVLLRTDYGDFEAEHVLICTNGFAPELLPELEVAPARNLVLVSKPIGLSLKEVFHYDKGFVYFREIDGRLLVGGARNADLEVEFTSTFGTNQTVRQALVSLTEDVILPGKEVIWEYEWSGIMGVGEKKMPLTGKAGERIGYAVRLGGMGVALGALLGQELADNFTKQAYETN